MYAMYSDVGSSLTSQTHFHKKRGKGLMNCVNKLCPAALYSAVQSQCSVLSYNTLHHCLSSNTGRQNGKRELGCLFATAGTVKKISTILLREHAYATTGNLKSTIFEIWLCHPANCIPVGHWLVYTVHQTYLFFLRKWVWLATLHRKILHIGEAE